MVDAMTTAKDLADEIECILRAGIDPIPSSKGWETILNALRQSAVPSSKDRAEMLALADELRACRALPFHALPNSSLKFIADFAMTEANRNTIVRALRLSAQAPQPSDGAGDEPAALREALAPFVNFASVPAFKYFADDFVLTLGSRMAMRQLTVGDFRKLLAAFSAPSAGKEGER